MAKQLLPEAEQYAKQNNLRQIWRKFVRVMACVVVFCTTYALILPAITMEKDLVCGMEEHVHAENCYAQVTTVQRRELTCTYESLGVHVHGAECADAEGNLTCGRSDYVLHAHDDSCTDACTLPEISGHVHADGCYQAVTAEPELVCGLEETEDHTHSDACWQTSETEPELVCGRAETILHSHTEACYDAEDVLTCALPVLEQHIHGEVCFTVTVEAADTQSLTCGLEESETHTHTDRCYGTWELVCEMAEHTHTDKCYPAADAMAETVPGETDPETGLTEAEQAAVDHVISLIEAMPSADEIDAKIEEFEAAEDYEGEEAWLTEVYQQVAYAYSCYSALTEEEKAQVTNADKLLELEYIWSTATLATYTKDPTIYQINSYVYSWSGGATMAHGGTVGTALGVTWEFVDWIGVVVEEDGSGNLYVEQIADSGTNKNSLKADTDNGFVLLFYDDFAEQPIVSVGDIVTVDASIPDKGALKYNASTNTVSGGYGKVHFSSAINSITSAAPTPIETANTRDFVELNLYDYNGYVNANYWSKNNWYPGFQWNGGAYSNDSGDSDKNDYRYYYTYKGIGIPNAVTDRNVIDSIDFGNSLITNLTYGYGSVGSYTKAINATGVGYLDKTKTHPINWLYGNSSEGYTNKPIGYSTTDLTEDQNVMKYTLVSGYPALSDGTMLDYLFKDGVPAKKLNTQSIDGLFQYDPVTGAYYYNSRENHAQYENNKFIVYAQKITPNFITYPFGNFLPLNSISDSSKATQVGAFSRAGGVRDYVERILSDLKNNTEGLDSLWDSSRNQLTAMLEEYKENWLMYPRTLNDTSSGWTNLSPGNAIRDYFLGDSDGGGDKPSPDTSFITQDFLDSLYNIDWDVQTNFFFGMEMKMNFYQPKDGLTGEDTNKDGTPDYPMEFYFTGDDDVWVYIDGVLFLDLSGIHRHVGGKIDFVNGKVYYYELIPSDKGDIKESSYEVFTFEQILTNAGASTSGLNSKGTFENYSIHKFNFYYMERGSGSSVCRLNFNFPLLRQNTLSVEKELTADTDIKALGNPDFQFQVLRVTNGVKTEEQFLPGDWAYSLYDADGSVIQEIKVSSKYPDGRVEKMTIVDGQGNILCTETYDSDGNRKSQTGSGLDKVLRLGKNGIFTLKAGQRAEFVGIPEKWGQYYVRELLDDWDDEQYGTVSVSGVATERHSVYVDGVEFQGVESPILDMTNGSSTFTFQNKITTSKLGKLEISKQIDKGDYTGELPGTNFTFAVSLDGQLLPAGTQYTVLDSSGNTVETRTVGSDGCVTIARDQTARIGNILAGAAFRVTEQEASAKGYTVSYRVDDSGTTTTDHADGTIGVSSAVKVTVTNQISSAKLSIPVTKRFALHDGGEHSYTFRLTQVADAQGNEIPDAPAQEKTVTFNTETHTFDFELSYSSHEFESLPATRYYRITEAEAADSVKNSQAFIAQVEIDRDGEGIAAKLVKMWVRDGDVYVEHSTDSADFVNTLVGDLSLEKIVKGSSGGEFTFTVTILPGTSNVSPMPEYYPATLYQQDGTIKEVTLSFGDDNQTVLSEFKHGEKAVIHGIPIGAEWTIEETETGGYIVGTVVTTPDGTTAGSEAVTTGSITTGSTKVVYTNTQTYVLPETGGPGTTCYTMAGLMLMLCSAAYLLYRFKKRGREVV